jgi:hypothetical protein
MIFRSPVKVRYTSAGATVTCDGNSITAGITHTSGPSAYYPAQLSALNPIRSQFVASNLGISGQTTRMMNGLDGGSAAGVDSKFVAGKKNILIAWEGTNTIDPAVAGRTGAQAAQDMADYVAARLTANPGWIIIVMTTLPIIRTAWSQATTDTINGNIDTANTLMKANFRTWGAKACIDLRAVGSPFNIPNYTLASFETTALLALWSSVETAGTHVHLKDAGQAFVANAVAVQLQRLTVR